LLIFSSLCETAISCTVPASVCMYNIFVQAGEDLTEIPLFMMCFMFICVMSRLVFLMDIVQL